MLAKNGEILLREDGFVVMVFLIPRESTTAGRLETFLAESESRSLAPKERILGEKMR
jgi:hypothetical protein